MEKRIVGKEFEKIAEEFLIRKGCRILHRNYNCKMGEIDIIASDGNVLCFTEVKYRSTGQSGYAEEAVDYKKQKKICRTSDFFRYEKRISEYVPMRFDVIAINDSSVHWIKNAFDYIPK